MTAYPPAGRDGQSREACGGIVCHAPESYVLPLTKERPAQRPARRRLRHRYGHPESHARQVRVQSARVVCEGGAAVQCPRRLPPRPLPPPIAHACLPELPHATCRTTPTHARVAAMPAAAPPLVCCSICRSPACARSRRHHRYGRLLRDMATTR